MRQAVMRTLAVLVALSMTRTPAWSQLVDLEDECPAHSYLGNVPSDRDEPDWSEQAQGIANDGEHWFFTNRTDLFKYDANWLDVDGQDAGRGGAVGFPPELETYGINHFGDLDHYAGYLFVPFEGHTNCRTVPTTEFPFFKDECDPQAIIGVYRASDLVFVDWVDLIPHGHTKAGWVAIDPVNQMLYTSDDELVAGTPLRRYRVDVGSIENAGQGDFLTAAEDVHVFEHDGDPLQGKFKYMQGGVFTPWGDLYLSVGIAGESVADNGGGLHVLRPDDTGNFRIIEDSVNVSGHVGGTLFAYQYDPGLTGLGEEPEGIDWWNRDNVPGSRYPGQLHAILLDNTAGDDQIWLKHYRIDYYCVGDDVDTDGDGVTDRDEVYVHNTDPRVGDSDHDGIDDVLDNCPLRHNADQADLDGDGLGDRCDGDDDGDGQSDRDERACGSNELDPASLSPDFDGDADPDCVDEDDDADGQSDADELACGSDPRDADSRSPDFDGDATPDCIDPDDDADGVEDAADRCPGTIIPDPVIPTRGTLKSNRYTLLDDDLVFDRNSVGEGGTPAFTTTDTGGCNASQIADALRLGRSHYDYGITQSVLEAWVGSQP